MSFCFYTAGCLGWGYTAIGVGGLAGAGCLICAAICGVAAVRA